MSAENEASYLATVRELQQLAKRASRVTQDDILEIASMSIEDLRRRALVARDWHRAFAQCLDGIPEIKAMPGAAFDGVRGPKEIRAVVETLVRHCPKTWERSCFGEPKEPRP